MTYNKELTEAMTWLGQQPDTVFIGQQVRYPGNAMFATLEGVPMEKRIEMPVAEEMQLGISLGMALTGKTVISIYPRFDFLLLAMNQLVNHLDKLEDFTNGQFHAKVIIRVGIGSTEPLNPGVQHSGDYTLGLEHILSHVNLWRFKTGFYEQAYKTNRSSIIVEEMVKYGT